MQWLALDKEAKKLSVETTANQVKILSASIYCLFDMEQQCHVLSHKFFTWKPSFLKSLEASCVAGLCLVPMCPIGNQGIHMHFLSVIVVGKVIISLKYGWLAK